MSNMNKEEKPQYVYCVINPKSNERVSYWYSRKQDAVIWMNKRNSWYNPNYKVARTLVQLEVMDD